MASPLLPSQIDLPAGQLGQAGGWTTATGTGKTARRVRLHTAGEVEARVIRARVELARYSHPAGDPPLTVCVPPEGALEIRRPAAVPGAVSVLLEHL